MSVYQQGQAVQVFSSSQQKWLEGSVLSVDSAGQITVQYAGSQKVIPVQMQAELVKPVGQVATAKAPADVAPGPAMKLLNPTAKQIEQLKTKNNLLNTLENRGTQIAVVGDTSTGKSTTINFLLGFPVNFEAAGIGTRRPCVICQEYDETCEKIKFKVVFTKGGDFKERYFPDVAGVAAEVKEANTPSNESYFDVIEEYKRKNNGARIDDSQVFDDEPIYVTMYHKSFIYGLRLIDLPGLTSDCPRPFEIAKKYIQPGNVVVLVIGRDNPANAQFPKLAAKMTKCSKVIFMQNFATAVLADLDNNLNTIKDKIKKEGSAELAASLILYCTEYGYPKTASNVQKQLWKEGLGQEDWVELSKTVEDLSQVRDKMWSHATKLALKLKADNPALITGSISAGLEEPLNDLISYQLQNLDAEIDSLKTMVQRDIETKTVKVLELQKEVSTLNDPPQWVALLSRVAKTVSQFLDTTIEVRADNYRNGPINFSKTALTTFDGCNTKEEKMLEEGGGTDTWTGHEEVDKTIIETLQKYAGFEADEKLLCLRSWVRLLDEFTGMLAFAPMKLIKQENRRERMDRFTMGALGREDQPAAMLRLVVEANAPDGNDDGSREAIRWQLKRFQKRLMALVKRDIMYAMQVVGLDETGELTDFLRVVGVDGDDLQKQGERLLEMMQDVLLERVEEIIEATINGVKVMKQTAKGNEPVKTKHGTDWILEESGMTVRKDENARRPVGALWWLLPFKRHYLNGQIPWRELEWVDEADTDEGVLPPTVPPAVTSLPTQNT